MMKKIYMLLVAMSVLAENAIAQNDPKAKKVLDDVSSKLKTFKGVTSGFTYVSKSRSGKVNSTVNGQISLKGDKYYIKQGAAEIFSDGAKTWNYNGTNEVTVTSNEENSQSLTPQKLLSNFYDKDFTYKLISSTGAFHEIQMTPVDKRKNFQKVNVFVDKAKMLITKAKVLDKSGNTIEFTLKNINTSVSIPDATFVFNKSKYKKDIEVIE